MNAHFIQYQKMLKRIIDLTIASFGLVLVSPIFLMVAIAILITMGSPVFFKQTRPGKDEKVFKLWKFRTMRNDRDTEGHLLPDAERLTRLGLFLRKTSLDELPQLINVLKGEMSLVGPRPLLIRYLPRYNTRQRLRHTVTPGITGWAQVHGRNIVAWNTRLDLDVWYVEHFNLWLDCKILLLTFVKIFCWRSVKPLAEGESDEFWGTMEILEDDYQVFPPEEDEMLSS